jgi:nucleoside-diphosphate-sugar epimerase
MAAVKSGVVAVTGAAGFLGGWAVKLLLDKGYRVRACVRNAGDETRTAFLKAMPGFASGRLSIHSAELEGEGAFDAPFAGADGVLHISHVSNYNDHDYVGRVCANVIGSVNRSGSVKRVVVTSSIAAVISEMDMQELVRRPVCDEDRRPDETNPKRTPERGQGYSMGKLIAERAFSDAAAANGSWDSVTVCPGDNVGPILSAHQKDMGPWQHLIEKMLEGECQQNGVYRPWMTVDVRDDALCHIGVLESERVKNGERYLAWSTDARNVEDICADIARLLPELNHATPPVTDNFPDRIKEREAEFRAIWAGLQLKNDRVRAATGVTFRPLDDSIRDCVESLIAVAGVKPKTKTAPA